MTVTLKDHFEFKSPFDSKIALAKSDLEELESKLEEYENLRRMIIPFAPYNPLVRDAERNIKEVKKQIQDARDVLRSLEEAKKRYVHEKLDELTKNNDWHRDYYRISMF